jgi:uncharacterized membrane protein
MEQFKIENIIFVFFLFGGIGWVLETIQESIVRRKFVNKGFFKGPFALSHGIGGLGVYMAGSPFKAYPALVFLAGLIVCTAVEYVMAVFLEKCFKVKCWDYTTYPHTRWCHYKGRICLTLSLFFGFITLGAVYFFWDAIMTLAGLLGNYVWIADAAFITAFSVDAIVTITKLLRNNKAGIKMEGYAMFSDVPEIE